MPDIALLKAMSEYFAVSINELLSGKRLQAEEFSQKAEENLCAIWEQSLFSYRERLAFWKRKWLKDHMLALLLLVLAFVGAGLWLWWKKSLLLSLFPLLGLILYGFLRNRMMIYVERKIYDKR